MSATTRNILMKTRPAMQSTLG